MPDGSAPAFMHLPCALEPRSPTRRTHGIAAAAAVALHAAVLLPLLLWAPNVQPPEIITAVDLTPAADTAATPATPDRPVTESTSTSAAPEPTDAAEAASPPPPDPAATINEAEPAPAPPPPTPVPPTPAAAAAQPPPEPAQALASIEPPMTDVPAELMQAVPPPPDTAIAEAPPLPPPPAPPPPVPAATPLPPRPIPPHPVVPRPVVPRPAARPAPRPDVAQAAPFPSQAPAPASPPAAATAPSTAPPSSAPSSNAVPTWSSEVSARLQRAKRYPDSARDRGDQGTATATFTMDRTGHVLSAALVRSSGSRALDEEAVALIHRAEPLPSMPSEMAGATITLTVPITFSLR